MKNFTALLLLFILVSGCKKEDPLETAKIEDTSFFDTSLIISDWSADSVKLARLDTLVNSALDSKAIILYAEKSVKNLADFSKFDLKLNKDGSFSQIDTDGSKSTGIWSLIDSETTLRLENGNNQLIEHYNISMLTNSAFSFNVEIPIDPSFVSLHAAWKSRLGATYGNAVSKNSFIVMVKMRR